MTYNEFEKAVEVMQLCTKVTQEDLKARYKELSKLYHPDMPTGDAKKFDELAHAYRLLKTYMQEYKFSFTKEEFSEQHPTILNMEDWLSGRG
jgi:DnaJ-class molecular chaperone